MSSFIRGKENLGAILPPANKYVSLLKGDNKKILNRKMILDVP